VPVPELEGATLRVDVVNEPVPALVHTSAEGWGRAARIALPEEWVLRELPWLNLDDPQTFVALAEKYGQLVYLADPLSLLPLDLLRHRRELAAAQNAASGLGKYAISTEVVRAHFELLRALVEHVVAYLNGKQMSRAWASVPWEVPAPRGGESWLRFEWVLNAALRPFHARVSTTANRHPYQEPPLYAVAALQVFNIFVGGLPVRECEKCSRFFQRRQGGASSGQQWTTESVRYCSRSCARAAAQAAYRARKKQESHR
jgi:hypothetical protein